MRILLDWFPVLLTCHVQMFDRCTMRIHVTVMLAFVSLISGQNNTKTNQPTLWTPSANVKTKPEKRTIKHKPERIETTTGNDVTLEVKMPLHLISSKTFESWRKNNREIIDDSRIDKDAFKLRIDDVRMSDAGNYQFQYIYKTVYDGVPTLVIEVWDIRLIVNDDGDICSDEEVACKGYCIQEDEWCSGENVSLGLIIGGVVGSLIVLLACVLLFLLSRRGRKLCSCVGGEPGLTESGMREERALNELSSSPSINRRNGAVVSFAAKPIIQIYEREEDYNSESGVCGSDEKCNLTSDQNGSVTCKTTTV